MKKFNFLAFVALLGMFFVCSCGGSNSNKGGGIMGYADKMENVLKEGISKLNKARTLEELRRINDWVDDNGEALEDEIEEYIERHPAEIEKLGQRLEDRIDEIDVLFERYEDLYSQRKAELGGSEW